jgi:hypothetical protein
MRHAEIIAPANYPHVVELHIDPVHFHRLERFADDEETFRILKVDRSEPDVWTVHIGCASEAVSDRMDAGWN